MKHPKNLNSDFWAEISLLIFCLFTYAYLIPNYIDILEMSKVNSNVNSRTFPKMFTAILGLLSLVMVLTSIKKKHSSNKTSIDLKRSGIVLLSIIAYYIFMDLIGYITASFICGYSIMAVFSQSLRISWKRIIIFLAFVATIYVLFERMLSVPFPHGLIY